MPSKSRTSAGFPSEYTVQTSTTIRFGADINLVSMRWSHGSLCVQESLTLTTAPAPEVGVPATLQAQLDAMPQLHDMSFGWGGGNAGWGGASVSVNVGSGSCC